MKNSSLDCIYAYYEVSKHVDGLSFPRYIALLDSFLPKEGLPLYPCSAQK
jgi:hypothetical protein